MPFTISGTELVMTSSPSYASELIGLANVTTSANGRIVDTSFYTHVQYEYTYSNGTLYRLVPSGAEQNAFYRTFSDGVLGDLVASKGVTI